MPLKAIAFDAYGTLFDVYSVSSLAEELFPGKGAQLAARLDCDRFQCALYSLV